MEANQMAKKNKSKEYVGWSNRGRPFSPKEFDLSALKKKTKGSYSDYLVEFARQYRVPKLRNFLLKKA